ncbi:MAG TPA: acylphosphatase [Thauera sp.]|nr:acylphosphatase [Thauera sp.]HHW64260.1 acylphosphatase [Rhodocyclaceae bacterium]
MPEPADAGASPAVARLLRIHGRVQGVWYRASAQAEASRLGLAGWVRNRSDGSVGALAVGRHSHVEAFIAWAHQGPPKAQVSRVEVIETGVEALSGFEQRPTA